MNGKRYVLDTNTIIYAINDAIVLPIAAYFISIITEIELLSYKYLAENDKKEIETLLANFQEVSLSKEIKEATIEIRKKTGFKIPDSIILATAKVTNSTLVSSDKRLFDNRETPVISIEDLIDVSLP